MTEGAVAMVFQNEILGLLSLSFGAAVVVFVFLNWSLLKRLPRFPLLLAAYLLLLTASTAAYAAGFLRADAFRLLGHVAYLVSSLLMAVWCWTALCRSRGAQP
jgi:hypothetical protein